MALTTVTRAELKNIKAVNFKEGDMVDVLDKNGDVIYTINISYGPYSVPLLKTTVSDKDYNLLGCTPGTKGGWPYYIADFIQG